MIIIFIFKHFLVKNKDLQQLGTQLLGVHEYHNCHHLTVAKQGVGHFVCGLCQTNLDFGLVQLLANDISVSSQFYPSM